MRPAEFTRFAEAAVRAAGVQGEAFVSLVYVSDGDMIKLNMNALGHSGTTDVISCDLRIPDFPQTDEDCPNIEIYVCLDVAAREAAKRSIPFSREVVLYTVHGLLHMAGEDDLCPAAKRRMRRAEKRVMKRLAESFDLDHMFGEGTEYGGMVPCKS